MSEAEKPRFLCSAFCKPYSCEAKFYVGSDPDEDRELVVVYGNGRPDFGTEIPKTWTDQDLLDLILWPMKENDAPYPPWEVPARVFGSVALFAWWKDEKPV
jgi:hypothetical protein